MTSQASTRRAPAAQAARRHDPRRSARRAGLRHSSDTQPGLARGRAGRGFTYRDPKGRTVRDRRTLDRIAALAIPPAWTEVWICQDPDGHLQATGRDARGRKQYRYHARWRTSRSKAKFERILAIAELLPRIRRRCDRDLARRALTREKVLAAVVRLLELSLIRVGNDEYARLNRSFGLTTMRGRHVDVSGSTIRFRFRGKSGQRHEVDIRDRRLATIVRRCMELPGQELFQYVDADGQVQDVTSDDVNAYLREVARADVTTRDFRIWAGSVLAYRALSELEPASSERSARRNVLEAVRASAQSLGNTATVARQSYVHPAVLDAYLDGSLDAPAPGRRPKARLSSTAGGGPVGDAVIEAGLLDLLRQRLEGDSRRSAAARRGRRTG